MGNLLPGYLAIGAVFFSVGVGRVSGGGRLQVMDGSVSVLIDVVLTCLVLY
jgi:hypothetical protein